MQSAAGARAAFEDAPNVTVVEIPINDGWARDWGPSVSPPLPHPPTPPQPPTCSSLAFPGCHPKAVLGPAAIRFRHLTAF